MEKPAHKPEFPPLLPQGFHARTLKEVMDLCVTAFPDSTVRADIMAGLLVILERVAAVNMSCEVWLDGSFLTSKLDPEDVDFIVIAPSLYRTDGTVEQADLIEWLINREDEPKKMFHCHTDVILEFGNDSPFYDMAQDTKRYFATLYGHSVTTREPKGIIVIRFQEKLPEIEPEEADELEEMPEDVVEKTDEERSGE